MLNPVAMLQRRNNRARRRINKILNALDGNMLKKKNAKKKEENLAKKAKSDKEE